MTLRAYGEETVRGNVLGPEGGAVVNDQGDQLDVPVGALDDPTAVVLRRGTVADLPLAAPTAGTVAGVVTLDLGGAPLSAGGSLRLSTSAPDPASRGLLLHAYELGAGWAWRVVGEIEPTASGWSTKVVDPVDLPWPGVRSGGAYVFFELSEDLGFVRGTVYGTGSQPLPGAVVDADVVQWLQIAGVDGSYALPLTLSPAVVTAHHPTGGDAASVSVTVPSADARVDLDLQLQAVAPWVVEVSPADAAVDVPLGIEPTVRFSEPVERASLITGVELVRSSDGTVVAIDFDHQGDLVRLLPAASLEPGSDYEVRVSTAVRDLDGHALPNPLTTTFTTQADPASSGRLDPTKVALIAPGPDGLARAEGAAGAAPADALVYVENLTTFVATESVQASPDGSFQIDVGAVLGDRLLLHVLIEGASADLMVLGPYLSADRRAAWAPTDGASWTTADGLTLTVEEGTFSVATWVRAETRPVAQSPVATPEDFTASLLFDLDFDGARPTRPLRVRLPASSPDPSATHVLARYVEALGLRGWMVHSLPRVDAGALTDEPEAAVQPVAAAVQRSTGPGSTRYGTPERYRVLTMEQMKARRAGTFLPGGGLGRPTVSSRLATPQAVTGRYLGDPYLLGVISPGTYQAMSTTRPVTVITLPVHGPDLVAANTAVDPPFLSVITGEILSLLTTPVFTLLGWQDAPYALEVHDLATGYTLYDGLGEAPAVPFLELPSDTYGDTEHPIVLGGSPIRFFHLQTATPQTFDVAPGVTVDLGQGAENRLRVTGSDGATVPSAEVKVLNYESEVITATRSSASGAFQLDAPFEPGQRFLLAIGGVIRGAERAEIRFSEPLASGNAGFGVFEVDDGGGLTGVILDGTTPDGGSTLHFRPATGWRKGTYRLRIDERLADAGYNAWPKAFEIDFEVTGSAVLSTTSVPRFADMASLGDLLFVASGDDGLRILDASHPKVPRPYLGVDKGYPFALGDPVRGVDVDAHGRVFFTGGGVTGFGQIKILDPLAIDPARVTDEASADAEMAAAYRGSTVISDPPGGGTWLPEGHPFRVATLTNDRVDRWRIATEASPTDVTLAPAVLDPHGGDQVLTLSGSGETEAHPVSVRNLTRGRFRIAEAAADGSWTLQIGVESGDLLELRRNVSSHAYVAVQGAGIAATHVAGFWDVDLGQPNSQAVEYLSRYPVESLPVCDANRPNLSPVPLDLAALVNPQNPHPTTLVTLLQGYGPALLGLDLASPAAATGLGHACGAVDGVATFGGLAVLPGYASDLDGDGRHDAPRDYVVVTHAKGFLLIYDVTDRGTVREAGRIRLVADATGMEFGAVTVDPRARRAYVAAAGAGLFVVDLDRPEAAPSAGAGADPRVLERLEIPGEDVAGMLVLPESGIAFAGGRSVGLTGVRLGAPTVELLGADGGPLRRVSRLAPFGVPTAPETRGATTSFPGVVRLRAVVPGLASNDSQVATPPSLAFDVVGLGPGGLPSDDAGEGLDLPTTRLDGVELRRQAGNAWEEGHRVFLSDPVVLLADLRASAAYVLSAGESDVCDRCDPVAEGVYASTPTPAQRHPELLSGHTVGARFADVHAQQLADFYEDVPVQGTLAELPSVPWDISPSVRQEPAQNPSFGLGDVAPGTLLHSGEVTHAAVDLTLRGLGFDFAFTRTYRSQTVGSGPLGPGWDHGYRVRLRELPDGSVDLFDGLGRRERFEVGDDGRYRAPVGRFVDLERTASGWILTDPGRGRTRFDRFGRLEARADALRSGPEQGSEMRFAYDSASRLVRVTDTLDRAVDIGYDVEGRLTSLSDFSGRSWTYRYDPDGRLEAVETPEVEVDDGVHSLVTSYGYANPIGTLPRQLNLRDNLATITDAKGQTWLNLTMTDADGDGLANEVTAQGWGEGTVAIAYDYTLRQATVTDRRNFVHTHLHNQAGQRIRYEDPETSVWGFQFDAEGLLERTTEPLGRVTRRSYTADGPRRSRGNLIRVEVTADARGANGSSPTLVSTVEYEESTNQPVKLVSPKGVVTEIERDDDGLPKVVTRGVGTPEVSVVRTTFDPFGRPVEIVNPNDHVTTYGYHPSGPSRGYLSAVTVDPEGEAITTRFGTDSLGRVTSLTDPRGVRHEQEVNALGWTTKTRQAVTGAGPEAPPLGYETKLTYDANGNVVEARIPYGDGGAVTLRRYGYDLLDAVVRVEREVEPGGPWITETVERDDASLPIRSTDGVGNVTETDYDGRGLVEEVRRGLGVQALPLPIVETFVYDAEGQLSTLTDGTGKVWTSLFDGYGRAAASLDPLGNRRTVSYDDHGLAVLSQSWNPTGGLLSESSSIYDPLDRVTSSTGWLWQVAEGDPLPTNRPASASAVTTTYGYDRASNLTLMTDAEQRTTTVHFDAAERPWKTVDPFGNEQKSIFDASGNVVVSTAVQKGADGAAIYEVPTTFTYDALGRRVSRRNALGHERRWAFDARGQRIQQIDEENHVTRWEYDGVGRRTAEILPEGIRVDFGFDDVGRLVSYRDALGNETTYGYDAVHRQTSVTYADGTEETSLYDAAGNVTQRTDARGTAITHGYDDAHRLTSITAAPPAGLDVLGPFTETYQYDGLGRLTRAQTGSVVATQRYDSLSRLVAESSGGHTTTHDLDDVGNPLSTVYPSGHTVGTTFDGLDRLSTVTSGGTSAATFGYRGRGGLETTTYGNGVSGAMTFDAASRPTRSTLDSGGIAIFDQETVWTPRNLKSGLLRHDQPGASRAFLYDGASRVKVAGQGPSLLQAGPSNPSIAERLERFDYDAAQNLVTRTEVEGPVETRHEMPVDVPGRNRPASINGVPLEWDASGNLKAKGDLRFQYDWRNRLRRIETATGEEVVEYRYDAFNRRVEKVKAGVVESTAWAGWRALESYLGGQLVERRTYGAGLDEVIRLETDSGARSLDAPRVPVYDDVGNLVALTDGSGTPIERYTYTSYGQRTILGSPGPVEIEQIRQVGDALWLEASVGVLPSALAAAVQDGTLRLERVADGVAYDLTVTQPVQEGRKALRRVVLTPTSPPPVGESVRLVVDPGALRDEFQSTMASSLEQTFPWTAGVVVLDTAVPELEEVYIHGDMVELGWSEPMDESSGSGIQIGSETVIWTVDPSGYRWTSSPVADGDHALRVPASVVDLSGTGFEAYSATVSTAIGAPEQAVFVAPDPRERSESVAANALGFHGLPMDEESGLLYVRNRFLDPDSGRFIAKDPLGYIDGPSDYAFAMNSPVNYEDPFGLYVVSDQVVSIEEYLAELRALEASMLAERRAKDSEATVTAHEVVKRQIQLLKKGVQRRVGGLISNNRFVLVDDFPIDLKHFLEATVFAEEHGYIQTQWGSFGDELIQSMSEKEGTRLSAFSPEDMPSNFMGAHFGGKRFDARGRSLAEQLEKEFVHIERWRVIWGVYGKVPEAGSPDWLNTFDYDINVKKPVPPPKKLEDFNWFQQQLIKAIKKFKEAD
ncbi:MAG: Ig-like domain-containing protein [Acidobacteriota bacterium]